MRTEVKTNKGVRVRAIAGTHVVFLAFDLDVSARVDCLGFAIKRHDRTEEEEYWLEGMKTFEAVMPHAGPGEKFSTRAHPIQGMQWADYSAKPDHDYSYTVIALYGKPSDLVEGGKVTVDVRTEGGDTGTHKIVFNRGAVASQEYARRFQNMKPSEVGQAAYDWLSRGLEKAIVDHIKEARDGTYAIHGAFYEFQWPSIVGAFTQARDRGVDLNLIYDALPKEKGPKAKNEEAIEEHGLEQHMIPRTKGTIMHNKFMVMSKDGQPFQVLTGSTNLTENGLFGHLNCVHVIRDEGVAQQYLEYWQQLAQDPAAADLRKWAKETNALVTGPDQPSLQTLFSPRKGLEVLEWYGAVAAESEKPVMVTLAFGMHDILQGVFELEDDVLRIALMEKPGNGSGMEQGRIDIDRIRRRPNVLVALGHHIIANRFDRWMKEIDRIKDKVNVRWVHTKFMLIDPLGTDPIVITGSANFSKAATDSNDENMVVIRSDRSVADIYFTEYLRVYAHHAFRESVKRAAERNDRKWRPEYLKDDTAWQKDYFTPGNESYLRRAYYIGS